MEDTLGGIPKLGSREWQSLNPCFNGRYSRRLQDMIKLCVFVVLILVLMEDTLGVIAGVALLRASHGLNPCFNGRYSRRLRLIFLCLSLFEVYLLLAERFS